MFRYGKTAQNAVSAMSYLAEVYADGVRLSSQDIAAKRAISKPLVAKLLVVLSQAGLVDGAPGPRGGYALARDPSEISLLEIVSHFEKVEDRSLCPFGPDWCGKEDPCPLHDQLVALTDQMYQFLAGTKLDAFSPEGAIPERSMFK
ncbi:RrF2 family transcriptional regulator [Cerasicoccus frondis]|uniref:RrF2 family transcriptional regulator n=1 Tax=Cerasicoccus frondis TaxID=490090 RepID=UPI0028526E2F|nr:Rrf2 family transcriptional regulator [Cerasicoccus frondis]